MTPTTTPPNGNDGGVTTILDIIGQPSNQTDNPCVTELPRHGCPIMSSFSLGELLNDEEMAAWHLCLNACQTLDDALDFHTALDALSPSQRNSFESSVPQDTWVWLWNLPEAEKQEPLGVPALPEQEPSKVQQPESKLELEPTLEELKALLLACETRVQLNELKRKHGKTEVLSSCGCAILY